MLKMKNSNKSKLYNTPLKSSRSGALFMAFSYPTKISPETIAVYILLHTKPGETILDVFGGSGTTGIATLLCDKPNDKVRELVKELDVDVEFGPRKAVVSELSTIGAFVSSVMTSKISSKDFEYEAKGLLDRSEKRIQDLYEAEDNDGEMGIIRHIVYTEFIQCKNCKNEDSYGNACVSFNPVKINADWTCNQCGLTQQVKKSTRVVEEKYDEFLSKNILIRKRRPFIIYGKTKGKNWRRRATKSDIEIDYIANSKTVKDSVPQTEMDWGDLHRTGYHNGISHIHHFYTPRNLAVLSIFWDELKNAKSEFVNSLKLWILSYNTSHSTMMTRVVLKKNQNDFVLTGAQPGVLYISSLPVEKNIIFGLERKIKTFTKAFQTVENSQSEVQTINGSSTVLPLNDKSIDYVFTDPPFGDYIPYSEINFINEAWLGNITKKENEAIISGSQNKSVHSYELLISQVFCEIQRVLKDNAESSIVFHSASKKVWDALQNSLKKAHLEVFQSSVLDKDQASFKQTNSNISVKGDPVLLLRKATNRNIPSMIDSTSIIKELYNSAYASEIDSEITRERLYSRYLGYCMSNEIGVELGAKEFYDEIKCLES